MPNQAISELLRLVTDAYQITSLSNSEQSKHSKKILVLTLNDACYPAMSLPINLVVAGIQ